MTQVNGDIMQRYTVFTLALLEDTGWYKPVYQYADFMAYGYNQGCDFVEQRCTGNFQEFCKEELQLGLSPNGKVKTKCKKLATGDDSHCMIYKPYKSCPSNMRAFKIQKEDDTVEYKCFDWQCSDCNHLSVQIDDHEVTCQSKP